MANLSDLDILVELAKPEAVRRLQIFRAETMSGIRLGCQHVSRRFGVSLATAKRDLRELRFLRQKLAARGAQ
jgi:DeoR/GlpR family transcriptional regulator of sugar metabolism